MKRATKIISAILIIGVVSMACDKDDGPAQSTELSAVKYAPNKINGKVNTAFSGKDAVMTPKNIKVDFKISKVLFLPRKSISWTREHTC